MAKNQTKKTVETIKHKDASRKNIPTAEYQSVMREADQAGVRVAYERRNRDLDPQLVWRGKDEQDWSDLVVHAPPLYIQEKVHPKALIDDLLRRSKAGKGAGAPGEQPDLFADFNGLPENVDKTDFYQHDGHWANRMILGDSLQVMASLAEREGLRGKVQCIYLDPPYGIKFNSNFQWSTTSRDVKDGNTDHITREPEQVKAFRDTWRDGIHSYLTYLRDRLTVARDLLAESGSIFVQIGDENVHRVRAVMDEVFGDENFVSQISVIKTSGPESSRSLPGSADYILWYARDLSDLKYRPLLKAKDITTASGDTFRFLRGDDGIPHRLNASEVPSPKTAYQSVTFTKPGPGSRFDFEFQGKRYDSGHRWWGTTYDGLNRVRKAGRIAIAGATIQFLRAWSDYPASLLDNVWTDTGTGSFLEPKIYVVQTIEKVIQRCLLLVTDPGDLVLDPTCGSGATAYVAEQWGRRWITIDTSRVALALSRARIMGARYPYYLLADSPEGQRKEAEITNTLPSTRIWKKFTTPSATCFTSPAPARAIICW